MLNPCIAVLFSVIALYAQNTEGHEVRIPDDIEQAELTRVAKDTFVVHGISGLPDETNKAFISNAGIVLTDSGVVLIDTGGSQWVGELILDKLGTITEQPVVAVFNTHIHGDHWLGNAAIRKAFPEVKIYAHTRAIERLQNGEAEEWRDTIAQMTKRKFPGDLVLPDRGLSGGEVIDIGGVEFKIHHTGHAHTDHDLMVEFSGERVLFTGDVVEHRRAVSVDVPQDFDISGQMEAIRYLLKLAVDIYVPGHGMTGGEEIPGSSLRFLELLYASVERQYEQGMADFEMYDRVVEDLAEFSDWSGIDQMGKLISIVYLQVEAAAFE